MRYLIAPPGPGDRADDFTWTVPGELLMLGVPCDDPTCGCDRAWVGMSSRTGTTTALVADVAHDAETLVDLARGSHAVMLGLELAAEVIESGVRTIAEHAAASELGALVRMADWGGS